MLGRDKDGLSAYLPRKRIGRETAIEKLRQERLVVRPVAEWGQVGVAGGVRSVGPPGGHGLLQGRHCLIGVACGVRGLDHSPGSPSYHHPGASSEVGKVILSGCDGGIDQLPL